MPIQGNPLYNVHMLDALLYLNANHFGKNPKDFPEPEFRLEQSTKARDFVARGRQNQLKVVSHLRKLMELNRVAKEDEGYFDTDLSQKAQRFIDRLCSENPEVVRAYSPPPPP